MRGTELHALGRKLMDLGARAIAELTEVQEKTPHSAAVVADVLENPGSSTTSITRRTGLRQDAVTEAVAALLETGRVNATVVRSGYGGVHLAETLPANSVAEVLALALDRPGGEQVDRLVSGLEALATLLGIREGRPTPALFDSMYAARPAWEIGHPQRAIVTAASRGCLRGPVLDIGCGTGEHTLLAARHTAHALGIDTSVRAIGAARRKADGQTDRARFLVWDALDVEEIGEDFCTVIDSGLFHNLTDESRTRYAEKIHAVTRPQGRLLILCFSQDAPPLLGPRLISTADLYSTFHDGWAVEDIQEAVMELTHAPQGVPAWLASIRRR